MTNVKNDIQITLKGSYFHIYHKQAEKTLILHKAYIPDFISKLTHAYNFNYEDKERELQAELENAKQKIEKVKQKLTDIKTARF